MSENTIRERLEDIFSEHFGHDLLEKSRTGQKIFFDAEDPDRPPVQADYCDSLDRVELIMAIEDHFGLVIPDKDAEALTSLDLMEAYITQKASAVCQE